MKYITLVYDNWPAITSAAGSIVLGARVLVKLLPNPKADTYFEAAINFLKHLGLAVNHPDTTEAAPKTPTP